MKVPGWLSHLRADRRGIPVPYINRWGPEDTSRLRIDYDRTVGMPAVFLDDDGQAEPDFFHQSQQRQRLCMVEGLCQVCARHVPWSRRFLVVSSISTERIEVEDREAVAIFEPWLDERCGRFALERCPGLIRRRKADDLRLVPVTSKRQVTLAVSYGRVDGPLAEESQRILPAMWVKIMLSANNRTLTVALDRQKGGPG